MNAWTSKVKLIQLKLGHFLLTNLLLDRIKEAPVGRIVVVSSLGHRMAKEINFDDINGTQLHDGELVTAKASLLTISLP